MNKLWINNTLEDRLAMLQQTEETLSGINQSAIEKDWWVTVVLHALSQCSCAPALIFKGGGLRWRKDSISLNVSRKI